jgi:hypothetical protein
MADVALMKRYLSGEEAHFTEALKASFRTDALKGWSGNTVPADGAVAHPRVAGALHRTHPGGAGGEDARPRARVLAAVVIGPLMDKLAQGLGLEGREGEVFVGRVRAVVEGVVG